MESRPRLASSQQAGEQRRWGRHGRSRAEFLRREEERQKRSEQHIDADAIFDHHVVYTGDESPIPSRRVTPPANHIRQHSEPSSLRHMNTDISFDEPSILASTPYARQDKGQQTISIVNNNRCDRVIDGLCEEEDATGLEMPRASIKVNDNRPSLRADRPITAPSTGMDSMNLLRKLSRATPSPPEASRKPAEKIITRTSAMSVDHEEITKPAHPKSALEAVLHDSRGDYGDSTVGSLENIMNPTIEQSNSTFTTEDVAVAGFAENDELVTQAEKDRRQEDLALENLNKRLRSTRTTIKDANRGLRRIENRIEAADGIETDTEPVTETAELAHADVLGHGPAALGKLGEHAKPKADVQSANREGRDSTAPRRRNESNAGESHASEVKGVEHEHAITHTKPIVVKQEPASSSTDHLPTLTSQPFTDHDGRTVCIHCGGRYASVWRGLWSEFRENFYTYDTKDDQRIRLTRIGWITLLGVLWFALENALCTELCDYVHGPVIPFVTFHYAVRPFVPVLRPIFRGLAWFCGIAWNMIFSEQAQSRTTTATTTTRWMPRTGSSWTAATIAGTRKALHSAREAVDEVGRIWDDEYTP